MERSEEKQKKKQKSFYRLHEDALLVVVLDVFA